LAARKLTLLKGDWERRLAGMDGSLTEPMRSQELDSVQENLAVHARVLPMRLIESDKTGKRQTAGAACAW
jgi:hypothetical protein